MAEKCLCGYCKSRHSWDCDDGLPYPRGGCKYFALDWSALTSKQQKAVIRILSNNNYDRPESSLDWDW